MMTTLVLIDSENIACMEDVTEDTGRGFRRAVVVGRFGGRHLYGGRCGRLWKRIWTCRCC